MLVLTRWPSSPSDDEIKLEDFTTEDELLTIGYPEDWFIEENDLSDGVPGVMLANSEDALTSMMTDETDTNLAEGETGIAVLILPVDMLVFMGIELPTGENHSTWRLPLRLLRINHGQRRGRKSRSAKRKKSS